jgi:hypothetical protein
LGVVLRTPPHKKFLVTKPHKKIYEVVIKKCKAKEGGEKDEEEYGPILKESTTTLL